MSNLDKLLEGVAIEWKPLAHPKYGVAELSRGRVMSKEYLADNAGIHPVYSSQTANNGEIGKIKTFDYDGEAITWTTDGANAGTVFHRTGKFSITNVCGLVKIIDEDELSYKFLFYWLSIEAKKHVYSGMGNPKLMSYQMEKIQIPIPPLSVQNEIVRILDTFTELATELATELTTELTARKKQYNYYRDQLLSFEETDVEWKPLGDVSEYSNDRISFEKLDKNNYVGVDNLLQNREGKTISTYVPQSGNSTKYNAGDILIGNIRPYLKKIWHADRLGGTNGDVLVIHLTDKKITCGFLYHILADDKFFVYNMQNAKGAKMPRGNKGQIMEYIIPVPPLEEQERIVAVLDKFDTLTTSISEGLPKEIEQRKKQYEYYRDMLLTFPKKENI